MAKEVGGVKQYLRIVRMVVMFGQLGFTLITPPVVMALLGWWLQNRFQLGPWVVLVCILLGLLTAGSSAVRFFRRVLSAPVPEEQEEKQEKPTVFYRHE